MRVLLDGWQLVYNPLSAAAFHALEILEIRSEEVELVLALPAQKPAWLTEDVRVFELIRPCSAFNHLRWVQIDVPRIARQVKAEIIHSVQAAAPLFASQSLIYSPTDRLRGENFRRTFWERLDEASGWGGASRAVLMDRKAVFEPKEPKVDFEQVDKPIRQTFSCLITDFFSIPHSPYFLYQSFGDWERLQFLLQLWSKTTAHLGDQSSLAIICVDFEEKERIEAHSSPEFLQTLQLYVDVTPPQGLALLREATAVIQLEDEPLWGGMASRAIGQGVPVVGFEIPSLDNAIGEAGYLVPEGDERTLSAALMTLIVEEEVLQNLRAKAQQQARRWAQELFREGLLRLYRQAGLRKSSSTNGERTNE